MSAILQHTDANDPETPCYTDAEQRQIDRNADALTYERLRNRGWWEGCLEGVNAISMEADAVLARCLVNLPGLRRGDQIALDFVTTALTQLERVGITEARKEALEQAEAEFEAEGK